MQGRWLHQSKKAISSLYLSLDKHFDQIDSKANELISLIGLITEKILHPDSVTNHSNNCQTDCLKFQKGT